MSLVRSTAKRGVIGYVITTAANDDLVHMHDRMPAIIKPDDYGTWLDEGGRDLLRPCTAEMESYPVGRQVNNPLIQGTALVRPLA